MSINSSGKAFSTNWRILFLVSMAVFLLEPQKGWTGDKKPAAHETFAVGSSLAPYCNPYSDKAPMNAQAYWQSKVDTIVLSKVIKIKPRFNEALSWDNSCWAQLEINETLKGNGRKSLWAHIKYIGEEFRLEPNKYKNTDSCPLKKGRSYIVFGFYFPEERKSYGLKPERIVAAKSNYSADNCTPIVALDDSPELLKELRTAKRREKW